MMVMLAKGLPFGNHHSAENEGARRTRAVYAEEFITLSQMQKRDESKGKWDSSVNKLPIAQKLGLKYTAVQASNPSIKACEGQRQEDSCNSLQASLCNWMLNMKERSRFQNLRWRVIKEDI